MTGAVYYRTKFGASRQYAEWLSAELGYEVRDIMTNPRPGAEETVVIVSPIMMGKLAARGWVSKHWPRMKERRVVLLAVGGAKLGSKDRGEAVARSLPDEVARAMTVFQLRGRFDHSKVNFLLSRMLKKAMEREPDPVARKEWTEGFDDVKREYLEPVLAFIRSPAQDRPGPGNASP